MLLTASGVIKAFFKRLDVTKGKNKITETKLYRLAKLGHIPPLKLYGRVCFDEDTLSEWFREQKHSKEYVRCVLVLWS